MLLYNCITRGGIASCHIGTETHEKLAARRHWVWTAKFTMRFCLNRMNDVWGVLVCFLLGFF